MSLMMSSAHARLLEQTTDAGIEVHAGTLPQLFDMAALATMALQCLPLSAEAIGEPAVELRLELTLLGAPAGERGIDLAGHDTGALLVHWLGELSYLLEKESFVYTGGRFEELGPTLSAVVSGVRSRVPVLRELKGVTYHELVVSPVGDEWRARISYDL